MVELTPLPIPPDANPYTVLGRRVILDSPWIRLREDVFQHRRGASGQYPVCGFRRTACGVLALDDQDRVVLVGQWRFPLESYSWELVEGGGMPDESPLAAIQRELVEEAGLIAGVWEPLVCFHPSNSSTDEEAFMFLARDLREAPGGRAPEQDEELLVRREPFAQCVTRVLSGEIRDSLTAIALLALQARRAGCAAAMAPGVAERFFQVPARHPSPGRSRWGNLETP